METQVMSDISNNILSIQNRIDAALAAAGRPAGAARLLAVTIRSIDTITEPALIACAAYFGKTRLIDNAFLE